MDNQRICALKGQKRVMYSNAFALSGRILAAPFTQGVALGYVLLGFQPVLV